MSLLVFGYTAVMWSMIILIPETLIRIFSSDAALIQDAVPALNMYFAAFIFMDLQYIGQAVFKSLNKKVFAIFFSLLRKVFIVVPLTYFLPTPCIWEPTAYSSLSRSPMSSAEPPAFSRC